MTNDEMNEFLHDIVRQELKRREKKHPRTRSTVALELKANPSEVHKLRKKEKVIGASRIQNWCEKLGIDWHREIEKERKTREAEIA